MGSLVSGRTRAAAYHRAHGSVREEGAGRRHAGGVRRWPGRAASNGHRAAARAGSRGRAVDGGLGEGGHALVRHVPYKYASGREGEWFALGIASQKNYISLYAPTLNLEPYVARLPKANLGRGCIRFKRLDDVDLGVIDEVIRASAANDGQRITS